MRNLLTGTVSSLALAVLLSGAASAATVTSPSRAQQVTGNLALQGQFERDSSGSDTWMRQSPLGQVITSGDAKHAATGPEMGAYGQSSMAVEKDHMHLSRDN